MVLDLPSGDVVVEAQHILQADDLALPAPDDASGERFFELADPGVQTRDRRLEAGDLAVRRVVPLAFESGGEPRVYPQPLISL